MRKIILIWSLLLAPFLASAYERGTHARLTNAAYSQSVLVTDPNFVLNLGIENSGEPFGEEYYDVNGNGVEVRRKDDFEETHERMPKGINPLSIPGWLMRGAIREDDAYEEDNPQDDPYPSNATLKRPLHHFYDPYRNRELFTGLGDINLIETGQGGLFAQDPDVHKAPDWALGVDDAFAAIWAEETNRRNHFTLQDAFEAYFRALTAHARDGADTIAPGGMAPGSAVQEADVRKACRAKFCEGSQNV